MATDMRAPDANEALVRRAIGSNHGAANVPSQIFAPDFVSHRPSQPPMDRATFEQGAAGVTDGLPDYTWEIHTQIAHGDLILTRVTWRGVCSGNLAGIPATGQLVGRAARNQPVQGDGLPGYGAVGPAGHVEPPPADRGHP